MLHIEEFIDNFIKVGHYPIFNQIERCGTNPIVKINQKKYLMFASNNYLSLSNDKRVIKSAIKALKLNGLGPGGSRFLCGNLKILEDLEAKISSFIGVEDTITFPTGYMANMAAISVLVNSFLENQPHDIESAVVFSDKNNHATLADGIKISKAKKVIYPHLDYEFLENELNKYKQNHPKLIVTESVYSMDGDIADIRRLVNLAKKHDSMIMVDDAHGVGILGSNGGGILEYFDLKNDVDLVMGSCDKALGGLGGYLGGKKKLIRYARIASRPYIFSSTIPASIAGGLTKSIEICQKEKYRRSELLDKSNYLRAALARLGYKVLGNAKLPVLPIFIGDDEKCKELSRHLFSKKVFAPAIIWPAVPLNTARLRITLMFDHKREHLDYLIKLLKEAKDKFN